MENTISQLKGIIKTASLKTVAMDENMNTLFQKKGQQGLLNLISRAESCNEVASEAEIPLQRLEKEIEWNSRVDEFLNQPKNQLTVLHENKLLFKSEQNSYYILGQISQDLSSLRITLMAEDQKGRKERTKIDLYEKEEVQLFSENLSGYFNQDSGIIEANLLKLTDLLEKYREGQLQQDKYAYQNQRHYAPVSPSNQKECIAFLSKPNLIHSIDDLIEKTGVIGEESTRKLLFVIASTYKMSTPLHSLVQGSSGSGKSHLINSIGQSFPPEDVISMTRVTSKSFYHYNKNELVDKLILIQDFDGLDEEAQYAFRELQSAGNISSSTTYKDRSGNLVSGVKVVKSHFASLLATTKADIYYDNMSRSIVLGVDESDAQTMKIIDYQNKKLSGEMGNKEELKNRIFLQNCMRLIKPLEVINKYADKVRLPVEAKMLRRLNSHYQSFVKQITILNQYQRKKDEQGRLITEIEDLQVACDILFDAIMIKVDDLDTSLRQFFDRVKALIKSKNSGQMDYTFTQREIRLALNISKAQCFRYMEDLERLEYIQKTGGYSNKGFKYKIVHWDDMDKIKAKVKKELNAQLSELKIINSLCGS